MAQMSTASGMLLQAMAKSLKAHVFFFSFVLFQIYTKICSCCVKIMRRYSSARIIMDRETGRSRGFGFVTYTSTEEAAAAITGMDGKVCCP
jgi:RNA recognition motif-containing protein